MSTHNGNGHAPNGAYSDGNGHSASLGHDFLWDGLSPTVVKELRQPLDPALVSQRKGRGGRSYDYLEGHTVIDQANAIFGFGGWGYELAGEVSLRRIESVNAKTGEVKVSFAYSAPVRVSVNGAPARTDLGFHVVAEDTPEGHETAAKGAVTDGLKRALRTFGQRFGNGLYADQPVGNAKAKVQSAKPAGREGNPDGQQSREPKDDGYLQQLRSKLIELGAAQGFDEAQVRAAVKKQTGHDLDELTGAALKPLVDAAARKVEAAKNGGANDN